MGKQMFSKRGEPLIGLRSSNDYGHEMLFDAAGHLKKAIFIAKGTAYVPVAVGDKFVKVKRKSFVAEDGRRGPCQIEVDCVEVVEKANQEGFAFKNIYPGESFNLSNVPTHTWYGLGREKVDVVYLVARDRRFPLPKEAEKGKRLGELAFLNHNKEAIEKKYYSQVSRSGDKCEFILNCASGSYNGWICSGSFKHGDFSSLKVEFRWYSKPFHRDREIFVATPESEQFSSWQDVIKARLKKVPENIGLFRDLVNLPIADGELICLNKPILEKNWNYGQTVLGEGIGGYYEAIFNRDIKNNPNFVYDEDGLLN